MSLYPQATLSIGKVLDAGFSVYRATFKQILPTSFLVAVVSQLPQFVPYMMGSTAGGSPAAWATMGLGFIAGLIIWFFVYMSLYNGWIKSLDSLARGGPALGAGAMFSAGLSKVLPLIGAAILFVLAMLIGFVLLVVPGLILLISLVFFSYLIVLENKGAIEALKASHNLVWGSWWRTATVMTVASVIYFVAMFLVMGVAGAVIGISTFGGPTPEQAAAGVNTLVLVVIVLQVVLTALLLPMWNSLMLVLFRDLQLRKSGADLAARAAAA